MKVRRIDIIAHDRFPVVIDRNPLAGGEIIRAYVYGCQTTPLATYCVPRGKPTLNDQAVQDKFIAKVASRICGRDGSNSEIDTVARLLDPVINW